MGKFIFSSKNDNSRERTVVKTITKIAFLLPFSGATVIVFTPCCNWIPYHPFIFRGKRSEKKPPEMRLRSDGTNEERGSIPNGIAL